MNQETKSSCFQLLVIFTFLFKITAPFSINAYVTVTYYNETSNYTSVETCECGVYGLASPVANAMGVVGIPKNNNYQACDYNTEFTYTKKPWIALIERGNCTFSEKIQTAGRRNADAVVIYNLPETGNQTIQMANFGKNRFPKSVNVFVYLKMVFLSRMALGSFNETVKQVYLKFFLHGTTLSYCTINI